MELRRISHAPHLHGGSSTRGVMADVLLALLPSLLVSIVFFGLRALLCAVATVAAAVFSEWAAEKTMKRPVTISDGSAAVTGLLLFLSMPSGAPWWLGPVGAAFAIVLVKQLFGGLGYNFVNPALAARAFLLASWPVGMTAYRTPLTDAVTSATPLYALDAVTSATQAAGPETSLWTLLIGNIPGAYGEICKLALLLGGAYLLLRGVIDWRIPLTYFGFFALFSWAFGVDPLRALLSGGVVLAGFFMLTDYVTSPATAWGRVIFAFGAALMTVLIRAFGAFPEGVTYAILFMNVCSPLIEKYTRPRVFGEGKLRA